MVEDKLFRSDINSLLKNVTIVTLLTMILLFVVGKYGGSFMDTLTRTSCNAINEKYVDGEKPGEGICVKVIEDTDIKK